MARRRREKKKKVHLTSSNGVVHINATFNNTIITITDMAGNSIAWASGGIVGYKGAKKSTPYAAQLAALDVGRRAREMGLLDVEVEVKGPGPGRESAIRSLANTGLFVKKVKDVTPTPHNGCRPRKKRRV